MASLAVISEAGIDKIPTSLKQVGVRRDYQMIDPRLIDIETDFNPRKYDNLGNRNHIDTLKRSISEIGLIQPLTVRFNAETGRATIVDGESRLRAIMELIEEGHPILSEADVPCFPAPKGANDEASRLLTAITANTGKPLYKWELGGAFQRLFDFGLSPEKIAARTGHTERFIREAIELADAPDEVKELLSAGSITTGNAISVLRAEPASAVHTLKTQVAAKVASGAKGPVKRAKAPSAAKEESKNVSNLVLYAAEEMAKALDRWTEDATPAAETAVIEAHKAYRKLIRAPKQGEAA
jgi:ParB-like chromosome segregation protein Spo0J